MYAGVYLFINVIRKYFITYLMWLRHFFKTLRAPHFFLTEQFQNTHPILSMCPHARQDHEEAKTIGKTKVYVYGFV